MRLAFELTGRRTLTWLGFVAAAAGLSFVWVWSVGSARNLPTHTTEPSPAAAIAGRFPDEWIALTPTSAAAFFLGHASARKAPSPANPLDWLSSVLLFEQAHQDLASLPASAVLIPRFEQDDGSAEPAMPGPRAASRTANLLNDAQIASIKERLKLTPEQQQLWPSVEAALRTVAWRGSRDKLNHKTATLDPKGVENLINVLIPFVKKLREEQKDELRMIAHLMGLEHLASQL
jgi:hypothetical protein